MASTCRLITDGLAKPRPVRVRLTAPIGLFQGMFEKNILTFNPGWDSNANETDDFTDVRDIQRALKKQGIQLETEADERSSGPASFMVADPDGNPVLVDQHVSRPAS